MNRRQKIIVSITGIFIVLLALVGLTYAYFLTRITGNENEKSISVTTANLELVYGDGNNLVTASNIEPGDPITPKTFTVTNNGNATVEDFNIYLEDVINQLSRKSDLVYTITCTNTTVGATSTECEDFEVVENEKTGTELIFPSVVSVIATDTLDPATEDTNAEQHTYTLTVTYKEMNIDQSEDMNKEVSAKVNIYDGKTKFLATEIMNNVRTNTGTKYVLPSELPTKIAEEVSSSNLEIGKEQNISINMNSIGAYASTADEAYNCYNSAECNNGAEKKTPSSCSEIENKYVYDTILLQTHYVNGCNGEVPYYTIRAETTLSSTIDDYGTSYYYRGNVEDNYVNFAGMCWRIVRIAGDGSTKLILEDQYTTCDDTETEITDEVYTGNWVVGIGNYGYEKKDVDRDIENEYSIEYIMNYLNPVYNNTKSMLKSFYDFQTNKLKDYTNKLKAGDWCLDDEPYQGPNEYIPFKTSNTDQSAKKYYGYIYYGAHKRLSGESIDGYQPTLKCNGNGKILNEFANITNVSSKEPMYVGTLTADEIIYAGAKYKTTNLNYYLLNDYSKYNYSYFWSLSPSLYNKSTSDRVFHFCNDGSLKYSNVSNETVSHRPAVSLKSDVTITGGKGTIDKPYVIG